MKSTRINDKRQVKKNRKFRCWKTLGSWLTADWFQDIIELIGHTVCLLGTGWILVETGCSRGTTGRCIRASCSYATSRAWIVLAALALPHAHAFADEHFLKRDFDRYRWFARRILCGHLVRCRCSRSSSKLQIPKSRFKARSWTVVIHSPRNNDWTEQGC